MNPLFISDMKCYLQLYIFVAFSICESLIYIEN